MGVDADQFHVVAPDDGVQRPPSDVAGGPLNDAKGPVRHGCLLGECPVWRRHYRQRVYRRRCTMCLAARWLNSIDAPIGLPPPGYAVPLTAAIVLPAAYNPPMDWPSVSRTRASESVISPPLVPRSERPNAAACNGPVWIGTSGVRPPENARSYASSPRPKSSSTPVAANSLNRF